MEKPTIQEVKDWMRKLYDASQSNITDKERKDQAMYATMVKRPEDKRFMVKMLDESSQIRDSKKLAKRIDELIATYGVPEFLSPFYSSLFKLYHSLGKHFYQVAIPIIKWQLRSQTNRVILDEARPSLTKHLAERAKANVGQNVNLLGEVVLGDGEADNRYHHYLEALEQPDINYISVKISGIYAQTHSLNYEESFPELVRRLSELYQKAMDFPYVKPDGTKEYKFVNLDMEEYKDAHMTMRLFKTVLSKPEFLNYSAGIVVQAYLPDAYGFQGELLEFARERCSRGGAPIKMRLVKGCNLDMETVVSSLRGWPNPVRPNKTEVDANYLHILERALLPENASVLHIGMASHNLFTIAYAYLLTQKYGTAKTDYSFEMLEGMADHVWRAQNQLGNHVILYAPVVRDEHFLNAISYLVRRMDEQTAPDNFLTHSFDLKPGTQTWDMLEKQFEAAYNMKDSITHQPTRTKSRLDGYTPVPPTDEMQNEPDTDFDIPANQEWQRQIFKKWKKDGTKPDTLTLQVGKDELTTDKRVSYYDRSQEGDVKVCEMCQAGEEEVAKILEIAEKDPAGWRKTTIEQRHEILYKAANMLGEMRGDLIGCMCAITGKTVVEGDVEVSEGIDYCRFYTTTVKKYAKLPVSLKAKGTVLVISPWNFPCAIPIGGIVAALATGNTCILKPATVAAPVAKLFADAFFKAGVPREALQVIITDRPALRKLTSSPVIKHIILTGGTDTAQQIARQTPTTPLSAETGGKNAIILTASGDRDHAIMNAVQSAFGNAGQKCSACSLFLVEESVYHDFVFMSKLKDAAKSFKAGGVWNAGNNCGPMITNANEKLRRAFTLEPGEQWLVAPHFLDKQHYILAPSVKIGVKPGSYTFQTELFAPMLAVVPVRNLQHAIELVNSLPYGLTSGLQSLDEKEQRLWRDSIMAGNLYINRGITGAIVNRQPFGGMKLSAFGPGLKAGGPNYCTQFLRIADKATAAKDWRRDYNEAYEQEFSKPRDWNRLHGEQNLFRYLPLRGGIALRLSEGDTVEDVEKVVYASRLVGTPVTISVSSAEKSLVTSIANEGAASIRYEELPEFIEAISNYERLRVVSQKTPPVLLEAAAKADKYIAQGKPLCCGRLELLNYIKEQSIAFEYHRYGSIIEPPADE
ncbi:MAG: bifunctional proline dehydrogenase/L-glutamate gamma-semialdehyde dehydrogenase [Prevotellaceae bacterium]|nr:bifunctional proline dehydrogenase/L-glutamate gamma-semialdehyde dehydrogenase [Prevotellaceae bacterium]